MFDVGELIIYGNTGVCRVEGVTRSTLPDASDDRLFYELKPYYQKAGRIMTPVENKKVPMRRILNKDEAQELLAEMPTISLLWIESDKTRENQYKEYVRSGDCRKWVSMIKTLYMRRQERQNQGKRMTATDERYLRQAEDYLYSELSIPLGVPKEEMETYLEEHVPKMGAAHQDEAMES